MLVVDDANDLRFVVRETLERSGRFSVVGEAADGAEAVRLAGELQPDVVLLDLDMPGVSGLDALPGLRVAVPDAKVVILSGLPRERMEAVTREAGAVGYLEKGTPARRLVDELVILAGLLDTVEGGLAERRLTLDPESQAPRAARRFADETLRRWDCGGTLDTVELLVSELVTNAVIHARSTADVAVVLHRDSIRVEVGDTSDVMPKPRTAAANEPSGRGLELVAKLATAWGVEQRDDGGKVVWFEVPRLDDSDTVLIR